jgi:hypothetical protein
MWFLATKSGDMPLYKLSFGLSILCFLIYGIGGVFALDYFSEGDLGDETLAILHALYFLALAGLASILFMIKYALDKIEAYLEDKESEGTDVKVKAIQPT